jgi:phage shock protein PspC (stress-responsive transcriptional regulator)
MSEPPTSNLSTDLRDLRRSRSNRVVAGVLGGVAGRLGIDPLLLRIVTAVLALFGGVGIVMYALGWLLIPDEDAETSIGEQALGRDETRPAGLGTVGLAAGLVLAALLAAGGMFGSGIGWLLMILTVVGAVLLLRRQDGDGQGVPEPQPSVDYPGFPGYVPSVAEPATTDAEAWTRVEPGPVTEPRPADEPGPLTEPGPATEPGPTGEPGVGAEPGPATEAGPPHEPSAAERAGMPATALPASAPPSSVSATPVVPTADDSQRTSTGTGWPDGPGWPEGPDWGPSLPDDYLEPAVPPPAPVKAKSSWLGPLTLSAVVVALGTLAINDATWASVPVSAYVATALAIVGAGLLIGTWFGRARGLIGLGILLTLALPLSMVADGLNLESAGSVTVRPQSVEAVPTGLQEYGAGSVVYDLTELELTDTDSITIDIDQGVGELRVIVPPEADVTVNADVGLGAVEAFQTRSGGPGTSRQITDLGDDGAGGGEITLNLDLGVGRVEVRR